MKDSLQARRPRDNRFRIAMAVMLVCAALFVAIAASVAMDAPILEQDLRVSVWLHTHGNPTLTAFLFAITQLHSTLGVAVMSLIVAYFVWRRGDRFWVLALALAVPGGMLLNVGLKHLFDRPRPTWDHPLLTLSSNSFPSGHAAGATVFYGFLAAYMVWRVKRASARATAIAACALMIALVGFSRVYLGVHYLSDVLGAMSMSTAWLVLCLVGVRAFARQRAAAASG